MILATHFIVGASVASLTASPELLVFTPLVSHFVLDSLPHWEYIDSLADLKKNKITVTLDLLIGPLLIFAFTYSNAIPNTKIAWILFGGLMGVLPDGIVFIEYFLFPKSIFLKKFESFHRFFHSEKKLKIGVGLPLQVLIIFLAILIIIVAKTVEMR